MIKTFIVLYSILTYVGGTEHEQAISHGIQFENYDDCDLFFQQNKTNLMAGALDYAERRYGQAMEVDTMGCVTMRINIIKPYEESELKDFRTLWSNE